MTTCLRVIPGGLSRPLPRLWDGDRVKWGTWGEDRTTLRMHLPENKSIRDMKRHEITSDPTPRLAVRNIEREKVAA